MRTFWKYQDIESYDIFNEIEEKAKESQERKKKYIWKAK